MQVASRARVAALARNVAMQQRFATGQALVDAAPFGVRYGAGGRSSNSGVTATVFGSSGFVGRYLLNELGACGSRVYAPFRGCEMEMRHLKPMFDLGNLALMPFSPRDDKSIIDSLERSDVVINLIGKHYETKHIVPTRRADGKLSRVNYPFREVHVDIPRKLARLAREAGIKSFIHVSALAADPNSKSEWARTKYEGEVAVREEFPDAIIVRPATVFGAEDRFLNLIGEFQERLPFVPIVNNGETLYQPVYCLDVSQGLLNIVNNHSEFKGDDFQFVGPAEYSYREIVEFVQDVSTVSKPIVAMPNGAAELAGRMINAGAINPIFSDDMLHLMSEDCVAKPDGEGGTRMKTLEDLGLNPRSMDRYSFDFLHRFRPGGHFTMVQGYH